MRQQSSQFEIVCVILELEVQHPAAKLIANASKMQDDELGDATNLVTVFAGSVLLACKDLLLMGFSFI